MRDEIKSMNTKIISNAIMSGKAEFVWLKDVSGKPIKVLRESLHKNETIFYDAGNEVDYNPLRHQRTTSPVMLSLPKHRRGTKEVG